MKICQKANAELPFCIWMLYDDNLSRNISSGEGGKLCIPHEKESNKKVETSFHQFNIQSVLPTSDKWEEMLWKSLSFQLLKEFEALSQNLQILKM